MSKEGQNELLNKLAREAQKHSPYSRERQRDITQIIKIITDNFYHNSSYYYSFSNRYKNYFSVDYEYEDAVQDTLIYIIKNIDNYKPELGSLITWADRILKYRLLEQLRRHRKISLLSSSDYSDGLLEQIHTVNEPEESHLDAESLRLIIEEDSEKIFQNTHVKGNKNANFQYIFLLRSEGKSWQDIAKDLNVSIPTLYSFFKRSLDKLAPKIREYLKID